jgi:hypothetical protein
MYIQSDHADDAMVNLTNLIYESYIGIMSRSGSGPPFFRVSAEQIWLQT